MVGYNPMYCVILSADVDEHVGRGVVLLSGNDDPIYPYEERVWFADRAWHGGSSGNGPSMQAVLPDDDDGGDDRAVYDASFWIDADPEADAVRVSIGDQQRELPASNGFAVCLLTNVEEPQLQSCKPVVVANRVQGRWVAADSG